MTPTRFFDEPGMQALGLETGIRQLFSNLGWSHFLSIRARTFRGLTLEALSSFRLESGGFSFRLRGHRFTILVEDLRHILQTPLLPHPDSDMFEDIIGPTAESPVEAIQTNFWGLITNGPAFTHSSKSSSIIHPTLRIAHRLLVTNILFRTEVGGMGQIDIALLWALTRPPTVTDEGISFPAHPVDIVSILIAGFSRNIAARDTITCGGWFTFFALSLGVPLPPDDTLVKGDPVLSPAVLITMRILKSWGPGFWVLLHGQAATPFMVLPNVAYTAVGPAHTEWILLAEDPIPSQSALRDGTARPHPPVLPVSPEAVADPAVSSDTPVGAETGEPSSVHTFSEGSATFTDSVRVSSEADPLSFVIQGQSLDVARTLLRGLASDFPSSSTVRTSAGPTPTIPTTPGPASGGVYAVRDRHTADRVTHLESALRDQQRELVLLQGTVRSQSEIITQLLVSNRAQHTTLGHVLDSLRELTARLFPPARVSTPPPPPPTSEGGNGGAAT